VALLTTLPFDAASELVKSFGLELAEIEPLQAGSVNSNFRLTDRTGRWFFARLYEEQDRAGALAELSLLGELSRAGVPTVSALVGPNGQVLSEYEHKPFAIFSWLPGELLCQARVSERACDAVGAALARVHLASDRLSSLPEGRFRLRDLEQRLDRVEREASAKYGDAVGTIRERLTHYGALRDAELPHGLIHGDLFRDNVIWQNEKILALIDFESASRGPFAYDLMVTVLAWCFGDRFEPALVTAMLAGYHRVRPLSARELDMLPVEGALGALRFATTRITDYDMRPPPGKPPLRDYRRFLARLSALEAGALDACLPRP